MLIFDSNTIIKTKKNDRGLTEVTYKTSNNDEVRIIEGGTVEENPKEYSQIGFDLYRIV